MTLIRLSILAIILFATMFAPMSAAAVPPVAGGDAKEAEGVNAEDEEDEEEDDEDDDEDDDEEDEA